MSNTIPAIATTAPTTNAIKNINGLSIIPMTKIPPCGALDPHPNIMDNAPAIAEPTIHGGMIRSGSDAANGMAPSVIKESPMM